MSVKTLPEIALVLRAFRSGRDRIEGYRPLVVAGTTAIPRKLWIAEDATHLVDFLLRRFRMLQIHLELIFEKMD